MNQDNTLWLLYFGECFHPQLDPYGGVKLKPDTLVLSVLGTSSYVFLSPSKWAALGAINVRQSYEPTTEGELRMVMYSSPTTS